MAEYDFTDKSDADPLPSPWETPSGADPLQNLDGLCQATADSYNNTMLHSSTVLRSDIVVQQYGATLTVQGSTNCASMAGGDGYTTSYNNGGTELFLYRYDVQLASTTVSVVSGDTVSTRREGNDIVSYVEGVEELRVEDTTYMTGRAGIFCGITGSAGVSYWTDGAASGVTGSGAITVDPITVSGAGIRTSKGTGAITLDALTVAGAGVRTSKGSGAILLDTLQVSGSGTVSNEISGSGAIVLDALTVSGAGVRTSKGTGAVVLDTLQVAGAGAVTRKGTGAILLDVLQVAGAGAVTRKGSGAIVLDAATVAGAGNVFSGTQGSGAIELTALLVAGTGEVSKLGSGNIVLDPLQVAGAGAVTRKGSGAIVLAAFQVSGYDVPPTPANAYYIDGTAFDENGRMVTEFIGPTDPLPTPVKYLCGIAHDESGARYVTTWPGGGQVRYIEGFAVRVGGVQIIATSGKVGANRGLPVTRRGELVVTENLPVRAVEGIGVASPAAVSVTNAG
jgi:hypothetical protein